MSWKACAYVKELRHGLSVTEKFVLLMLAEYHRTDQKNAWPSVTTLAEDCLMTARGVQQILARLEEKSFICRQVGGGRGNVTAYQIVGIDVVKGEPQTANGHAVNVDSVNETLHSHAVNPAQPCNAIRNEPVLEPNGGTPTDFHPLQYATKILEQIGMTHVRTNLNAVTEAVNLLVREGKSKASAYEFLVAEALDALDRGEVVDKWWFEDAKWKRKPKPQPKIVNAVDEARRQLAEERAREHAAGN